MKHQAMKKLLFILFALPVMAIAQYTGTGSVTQGPATTTTANLYTCQGGRVAGLGTITATDQSVWTVPAVTNFTNASFPFASDLFNPCTGVQHATTAIAVAALSANNVVAVDADGELYTAFIFADNYFEMYVNGVQVGKDNVPFTQFNSNIVQFTVKTPFTIAMLLVDWEENLGLGSEANGGFSYHPGDGGVVVTVKDASGNIVATTGSEWKAQTFYSSPITDLSCPTETGTLRSTANCSTADSQNGTAYYGLHWSRPTDWTLETFDDSNWPNASTYTNATIGVNNKPAFTNFTDVFDAPADDAEFIWSSNVILDNEVIVRHTVTSTNATQDPVSPMGGIKAFPNPTTGAISLSWGDFRKTDVKALQVMDMHGRLYFQSKTALDALDLSPLPSGMYFLRIVTTTGEKSLKVIVE